MTKPDCKGALKAAVKGAFSDAEVEDLAKKFMAKKLKAKADNPLMNDRDAVRKAAQDLTTEEVKAGLISTRARQKAELAKRGRAADMAKMSGKDFDRLEALTIGSEKVGANGKNSVEGMGNALAQMMVGNAEERLRAAGLWDRVTGIRRDIAFERALAKDMAHLNGGKHGPSGDADAAAIAKILNDELERARLMQNDAGAWIGKLDGYIVRQAHDAVKVRGGYFFNGNQDLAREAWVKDIMPLLDERSFDGITPTGAGTAADRKAFLDKVWTSISSGRHEIMRGMDDVEGFIPKSGKARSISAERVLHFASPDAWMEYHLKYGRGSIFAAVVQQLERAGRNTALMRRFGPNPDLAWKAEVERAVAKAHDANDAAEIRRLNSRKLQSAYEQVNGAADAPEGLRFGMAMKLLRSHETVTKLGGMVLSTFSDIPIAASQLMRTGVPFLRSYGEVFSGILRLKSREQKQALQMLDIGARMSAGRMMSGASLSDGALGFYSVASRVSMDIQGFTFVNDGIRAGAGAGLSRWLGQHADDAFGALPVPLQRQMERFGVDAAMWDKLRAGTEVIDGQRYVFADHIADEVASTKLRMMVSDMIDNATSEAGGRERRSLTGGGMFAGTAWGEGVRALTQFLSFTLSYINRSLGPMAKDAFTGGPVMPLVNLILGTTLAGWASMQAKEMVKGRKPREASPEAFLAAMWQGGGLGIYGDFLFGEKTRMGGGLAETFGGPIVGDVSALYNMYQDLKAGKAGAGDAFKFGKSQLPFVNLWYTRAALDYLLFWRMQEAMDPGWASRYQRRVETENGAEFWLKPTEAVQ